jgi:protein-arginine kinase activator protein McsA
MFQAILSTTQCPSCGLLYGEFCERGLLGCEECYVSFAPAIRAALEILQQKAPAV